MKNFKNRNCVIRVPPDLKVYIQVNREGPKDEAEVGAWSEVIWQGMEGGRASEEKVKKGERGPLPGAEEAKLTT